MQNNVTMRVTQKVAINKALVQEKIKSGMSKEEIRTTYYSNLNKAQWKKALVKMELNTVRVPKVDFYIQDGEGCTSGTCENATTECCN